MTSFQFILKTKFQMVANKNLGNFFLLCMSWAISSGKICGSTCCALQDQSQKAFYFLMRELSHTKLFS